MKFAKNFDRRAWLRTIFGVACRRRWRIRDFLRRTPCGAIRPFARNFSSAIKISLAAQRLFMNRRSLAKEYLSSDVAPSFRANGSRNPQDPGLRQTRRGELCELEAPYRRPRR